MRQALYRKYRSKSFEEVVGQDHVVQTLKNALAGGQIAHAYLFTGPRGVGKTSVARILAHEVNKLPYQPESVHLDIIEIDAASNRRIDEIRDLREKVHIAPTTARYKVYIIDEAHMLTNEAFNALLKTLEEPPAHCIFILATTEQHKLPPTIVSRTQRFSFRPVNRQSIVDHLSNIAKQEKIKITPDALELLAEHGEGSFRDSISLLDQLASYKKLVDEKKVREVLGLPSRVLLEQLASAVKEGNAREVNTLISEAREQAVSPAALARGLSVVLREELTAGAAPAGTADFLRRLLEVGAGSTGYDDLEITLLEHAGRANPPLGPEKIDRPLSAEPEQVENTETLTKVQKLAHSPPTLSKSASFSISDWPEVVTAVKHEAASLYTALRLAEPSLNGDKLHLRFSFPLHQKKISSAKARDLIGRIIEQTWGSRLQVECVLDRTLSPPLTRPRPLAAEQTPDDVQAISNIFGGGELIESQAEA